MSMSCPVEQEAEMLIEVIKRIHQQRDGVPLPLCHSMLFSLIHVCVLCPAPVLTVYHAGHPAGWIIWRRRSISLQQTMLVLVPPQLVRYIVDLSWICVDKIELLRLHQRVGLDKPETMNIQGRVTDHIESIACHDYHAFRRLAKYTPFIA